MAPPTSSVSTYIAVIGPSDAPEQIVTLAEDAGRLVAEAGAVLVTGGGSGAMEAACRAAKQAGGRTLGILPGTSRTEANPYVDVSIPTGMGEMRNALVVRCADGLIAVGGGYGTLSEIALALRLGKPVVAVRSWVASSEWSGPAALPAADTPGEALQLLLKIISTRR